MAILRIRPTPDPPNGKAKSLGGCIVSQTLKRAKRLALWLAIRRFRQWQSARSRARPFDCPRNLLSPCPRPRSLPTACQPIAKVADKRERLQENQFSRFFAGCGAEAEMECIRGG